jgi:hypothetical protein
MPVQFDKVVQVENDERLRCALKVAAGDDDWGFDGAKEGAVARGLMEGFADVNALDAFGFDEKARKAHEVGAACDRFDGVVFALAISEAVNATDRDGGC